MDEELIKNYGGSTLVGVKLTAGSNFCQRLELLFMDQILNHQQVQFQLHQCFELAPAISCFNLQFHHPLIHIHLYHYIKHFNSNSPTVMWQNYAYRSYCQGQQNRRQVRIPSPYPQTHLNISHPPPIHHPQQINFYPHVQPRGYICAIPSSISLLASSQPHSYHIPT